jgi:hypothetical protein
LLLVGIPECPGFLRALEWADVVHDLERLQYVEVEQDGKRFRLRTELAGTCGRVFRAVGVAVPPTVQQLA